MSGGANIEDLAANDRQTTPATALQEWRKGWPVVFAAMFGNGLLSMGFMAMGTFMAPLETAFGWTRTDVALGYLVYPFSAIFAPFVGMLIDARGERHVAITGAILSGLAFALFATSNGSTPYWLALWMLYASINQLIMLTVWSSAIANSFVTSRGLALSIGLTGTAVAAAFVPLLTNVLIEHFGWRGAFVGLGLGGGGIVALVCFFGIPARAAGKAAPVVVAKAGDAQSQTVPQALRSATYIKLVVATFITYLLLQGLMTHLVPVLLSDGLVRDDAVKVAGSLGAGMIIGKLVIGAMLDRWNSKLVSALSLSILAAAFLLLSLGEASIWLRTAAVLLLGIGSGGIAPMFPYLVARIFGTASFGRLYGAMTVFYALANALGPVGASMVYDRSHSYAALLVAAPLALLVPLVLILSLGRLPGLEKAKAG